MHENLSEVRILAQVNESERDVGEKDSSQLEQAKECANASAHSKPYIRNASS